MIIYGIDGKKLLDAILTEGAEHEQELSKSDFVKLSWDSDVKTVIPAGAYIVPFADGLKYRLLDSYAPTETDKGFKYEPQFHHPLMLLSRIPFLYSTTDSDKNPIKQQEWSFDGLTADALKLACDAINEALGITTESEKFTFTLCGTVDSSISFSVSSNDILSVLSSMVQACKENNCEWHLSWEHKALYFGQVSVNLGEEVPTLKVHDNIQKASVGNSKESYYNCFYPQGSTKNMSRKAQVGTGNVATLARLGLDTTKYPDGCIYIGTDGEFITKAQFEASGAIKQTLALSFDDIYPHIDLYAYNIRKRTRWLKNDTTGEYEKNPDGTNKIYTVWYMRLAYCTTTKDNTKTLVNTTTDKDAQGHTVTHYWYDYDLDKKKQVLQGYTLKGTFKVNTHATNNQYDALSQSLVGQPNGQDGFELYFNERNETLPASETTGDSGMSVLKGDYEIKFYQSGDTIIPTNESDGLYPRGNTLPDLTCNIVILFNIVMGNAEKTTAQEELATRTIKEINRRTQDNNNYTAPSDPTKFAKKNPNLYIGQKVTYNDGSGYQLSTRVIKLVTKIDFPIIQDITVGNQAIKGTISQLKEDVATIMSGNWSGGGLSYAQVNALLKNYDGNAKRTFLRKDADDTTGHKLTMGAAEVKGDASVGGNATVGGNASVKGAVVTDDIHSPGSDGNTSMTGTGWTLKTVRDETGSYSVLAVDNIVVRKKLEAAELEIHKKTYVDAQMIASDWGHKILRVDPIYFDYASGESSTIGLTLFTLPVTVNGVRRMVAFVGKELTATDTRVELLGDGKGLLNKELEQMSNAFKVYFCESDGTTSVEDDLVVGGMGQCQEFNVKERVTHNFTNTYYWGVCVKHGVEDNVLIGGHSIRCVYGVFAHTTAKITLATEVTGHKGKTFTCYGMEQAGCTFPVAGDDMVGFGCADPWQDADRCNAIVIASKDGENSAPSVISYSGIGRMRGGKIHAASAETIPDYAGISEQYSIPDGKDDSRLDFRISKKKGNVFKGDMYLKGDNGEVRPVGDTYMLGVSAPVVEHGGTVSLSVYHVAGGKAVKMTEAAAKGKGLTLLLRRDTGSTSALTGSWGTIDWATLTTNSTDVHSVTFDLKKGGDTLDSISVSVGKSQTEVWRLMAVTELAETNYTIDKDKYRAAYETVNGSGTAATDPTADAVFAKTGNISLEYRILYQKGDGEPKVFTTIADAQKATGKTLKLTVTEFGTSDQILGQYTNQDGSAAATKLQKLCFTDSSPVAATVAYVKVSFLDPGGNQLDLREVRMKLGTNGAAEFNKQFLAYIYYGTSGGGTQYANKRISTMEKNYSELTKTVKGHDGRLGLYDTKIRETAEGLSTEVSKRETTDRNLGKLNESVSKISQSADEISTRVTSLYTERNLLWGGDVRGMVKKQYGVFTSDRVSVKKGLSYTVAARMWLVAKKDYPTQPAMDGHVIHLYAFKPDWSWQSDHVFSYTRAGTVIGRLMFTAMEDMDVMVGIYEQNGNGGDPKTYGGVAVDWVRMDMGDHINDDVLTSWSASAKDVEAQNLIPDVNFDDSTWKRTQPDGATREPVNEEIKEFNDSGLLSVYNDDYSYYGFRGVRLRRSGCRTTSSNGLRYYIPFRGEGDYTLAAMVKDLGDVTLDESVWIQMYPCGEDRKRNGNGAMFSLGSGNATGGYIPLSVTHRFADSEKNSNGESVKTFWIEVRVLLLKNGDVVVSRLSLAKNPTPIHWNANAIGESAGRQQALESYTQQRAGSIEAGIRQGLRSVGFNMDSSTWTVNTWGDRFAWYANKGDATRNDLSKAVMYVDSQTNTLHVKGYVEATGGKIGGLKLADDGLYQGGSTSKRYAYYAIDSLYLRGMRASRNNSTVYQIKFGWRSVDNADGTISPKDMGYADHGLNGAVEFIRTTKGNTSYVNLRSRGATETGDGAAYEGTNECALGVRCGDSTTGYGYGFINIGMLATHRVTELLGEGKINTKLKTEGIYIADAGITITMPDNPQPGTRITVLQNTPNKVIFNGNGYKFKQGTSVSPGYEANSDKDGQWNYFVFDGTFWECSYVQSGNMW